MKWNIFKCSEKIRSYTYPVIKIVLCVLLIIFLVNRNHFFVIHSSVWEIVVRIICFQIVILTVLCIYTSAAEMVLLHERRTAAAASALPEGRDYRIDELVSVLESNDILEITAAADGKVIRFGASSDCRSGDARFFDKSYYIDDKADIGIGEVKQALKHCTDNDLIHVLTIDDIPVSNDSCANT